jgi:hypothetical protein
VLAYMSIVSPENYSPTKTLDFDPYLLPRDYLSKNRKSGIAPYFMEVFDKKLIFIVRM